VTLIEDAAHALGALTPDGPVGACRHADIAVFSFHPVKAITAGEGGMVTTRRHELVERLREFRTHGMVRDPSRLERAEGGWYSEQQDLGFDDRLADMQYALGRSQLTKLERFVTRRNELAKRYRALLADIDQLELPRRLPRATAMHITCSSCATATAATGEGACTSSRARSTVRARISTAGTAVPA
jgi:dTDP-4-amino-4,6-dideoxygalactose transaminase